jgi:hypothetical protein
MIVSDHGASPNIQLIIMSTLFSWFKRDLSRNTFVYTQFLVGLSFVLFNTYVAYQLQITGFLIGTDIAGAPCSTYCEAPLTAMLHRLEPPLLSHIVHCTGTRF